MNLGLAGKSALLLASSRGLGFGIARALTAEGVGIFVCGRDKDRLDRALAQLRQTAKAPVEGLCCDLDQPEKADALVDAATAALGPIDIVLANSGGPPMGRALEVDDALWRRYFASMVLAPMRVVRLVVPGMVERNWGRVIAITASSVPQPIPEMALSNTLRAALTNWLKTLSAEVAAAGVTVNTLIPGRISTDRVAELEAAAAKRMGTTVDDVHRQALATIAAGREGDVEEFAGAALFLASRQGGYVTGGAIRVDGGLIRSTMA
jgi:3-oxoacyl-[acyl-carrier protein] reductase